MVPVIRKHSLGQGGEEGNGQYKQSTNKVCHQCLVDIAASFDADDDDHNDREHRLVQMAVKQRTLLSDALSPQVYPASFD